MDNNRGTKPRGRINRFLRWAVASLVLFSAVYVAGLVFSPQILCRDVAPSRADAIVVLGGEIWTRPQRAAEVFKAGAAPKIIASGDGDCQETRRLLEARGVPASAIELECKSGTTKENAEFTTALLRAQGARRVILVTSWFHSRRALACFRHSAPEIAFHSQSTHFDRKRFWPDRYERGRILREYMKLLGYWVRYGIAPV
jgi:uncharacterized SAM-binding protein YcdF (DUF218 family)